MVSTGQPVLAARAPMRSSLARAIVNEDMAVPIESVVAAGFSLCKPRREVEAFANERGSFRKGGSARPDRHDCGRRWFGCPCRIELLRASARAFHVGSDGALDWQADGAQPVSALSSRWFRRGDRI